MCLINQCVFFLSDSLLKPQREVGGVTDHAEQIWRVLLLVLFGPDAADQLRRSNSSAKQFFEFESKTIQTSTRPLSDNRSLSCHSPVKLRLKQSQLACNLNGVKGHEVKGVHMSCPTDVPFDGRRWALEGDVVTDAVGLRLQLPLYDLVDGLNPLSHWLTWKVYTLKQMSLMIDE